MNDLPKNLRIKAGIIDTLWRIEHGSDAVIMRQAADHIRGLTSERDALAAQVEQLLASGAELRIPLNTDNMIGGRSRRAVLQWDKVAKSTPAQCLAEHDAEVAKAAFIAGANYTDEVHFNGAPFCLKIGAENYANQLRQQAKGGE